MMIVKFPNKELLQWSGKKLFYELAKEYGYVLFLSVNGVPLELELTEHDEEPIHYRGVITKAQYKAIHGHLKCVDRNIGDDDIAAVITLNNDLEAYTLATRTKKIKEGRHGVLTRDYYHFEPIDLLKITPILKTKKNGQTKKK